MVASWLTKLNMCESHRHQFGRQNNKKIRPLEMPNFVTMIEKIESKSVSIRSIGRTISTTKYSMNKKNATTNNNEISKKIVVLEKSRKQ